MDTIIYKPVVELTYYIADHCEMTWAKLDLGRSVEELDVDPSTLNGAGDLLNAFSQAKRAADNAPADEGTPGKRLRTSPPAEVKLADVKERLCKSMASLHDADMKCVHDSSADDWHAYFQADSPFKFETVVEAMKVVASHDVAWLYYSEARAISLSESLFPGRGFK